MANIVAYHFSTSLPRVATHSVLPHSSRLSAHVTHRGSSFVERPGIMDFLRELAFEKSLCVDRRPFRIGLAATSWQLQQSLSLLRQQSLPSPLSQTGPYCLTDTTQDRVVALAMNTSLNTPFTGALATIWLRRDGPSGLPQDGTPPSREALNQMRAQGKRLVAVEALAFDKQAPFNLVLEPMMRALHGIVVDLWDATDIVTNCPRTEVAYYCGKLGFSRVIGQAHEAAQTRPHAATVLLTLPLQRMAERFHHHEHAELHRSDMLNEALSA